MSVHKIRATQANLPQGMQGLEVRDNAVVAWARAVLGELEKRGVPEDERAARLAHKISHGFSPVHDEGHLLPRFVGATAKEDSLTKFAKTRAGEGEVPVDGQDAVIIAALDQVWANRGKLRLGAAGTAALAAGQILGVPAAAAAGTAGAATAAGTAATVGGVTPAMLGGFAGKFLERWMADAGEAVVSMVTSGEYATQAAAAEFYTGYGVTMASGLRIRETVLKRLMPPQDVAELLADARHFGSDHLDGVLHSHLSPVSGKVLSARENPTREAIEQAEAEISRYLDNHPGVEDALRRDMKGRLEKFRIEKREKRQRNSKFTILVVDPNPQEISTALGVEGYTIRQASTSRQADRILREERINALVIERRIAQDEGGPRLIGHGDGLIRQARENPKNLVLVYTSTQPTYVEKIFMREPKTLRKQPEHENLLIELEEKLKMVK